MANDNENKDNLSRVAGVSEAGAGRACPEQVEGRNPEHSEGSASRAAEISRAIAKRRRRFAPSTPHGPANHRRIPLAKALETKLSEVADEISGRTFSEMIADKLVHDALSGKLPALVLSKLVLASGPERDQRPLNELFANKTNEELAYFVKHGRWPDSGSVPEN